jgi:hypothetical protein
MTSESTAAIHSRICEGTPALTTVIGVAMEIAPAQPLRTKIAALRLDGDGRSTPRALAIMKIAFWPHGNASWAMPSTVAATAAATGACAGNRAVAKAPSANDGTATAVPATPRRATAALARRSAPASLTA